MLERIYEYMKPYQKISNSYAYQCQEDNFVFLFLFFFGGGGGVGGAVS